MKGLRKRNPTAEVPYPELDPARTKDKQYQMVMTEVSEHGPFM